MASPRGVGSRTFTDMIGALAERCDLFSPNESLNFFKVARYLSGKKLDALLFGWIQREVIQVFKEIVCILLLEITSKANTHIADLFPNYSRIRVTVF